MNLAFSHINWEVLIIPIDEPIFFRGVAKPPTSIYIVQRCTYIYIYILIQGMIWYGTSCGMDDLRVAQFMDTLISVLIADSHNREMGRFTFFSIHLPRQKKSKLYANFSWLGELAMVIWKTPDSYCCTIKLLISLGTTTNQLLKHVCILKKDI